MTRQERRKQKIIKRIRAKHKRRATKLVKELKAKFPTPTKTKPIPVMMQKRELKTQIKLLHRINHHLAGKIAELRQQLSTTVDKAA